MGTKGGAPQPCFCTTPHHGGRSQSVPFLGHILSNHRGLMGSACAACTRCLLGQAQPRLAWGECVSCLACNLSFFFQVDRKFMMLFLRLRGLTLNIMTANLQY